MLFGNAIQSLERGLNYSTARNRAISNNIANADTPGYKAQRVSFQDFFEQATIQAKKTDERHLSFTGPKGKLNIPNGGPSYHHNGNGVDIDQEMTDMAKNQIYYNTSVDLVNSKFNGLKESIRGG